MPADIRGLFIKMLTFCFLFLLEVKILTVEVLLLQKYSSKTHKYKPSLKMFTLTNLN